MASSPIVSVDWLQNHKNKNVRVVDASWHLPPTGRNGREEYQREHIPNAVYFDIDECSTPGPLPHTLPSAEHFAKYVGELGISETDHVVVYDVHGWFSAARVWWMLRYFGSENVSVLNGGFSAWKSAGLAIDSGSVNVASQTYVSNEVTNAAMFTCAITGQVLNASNTQSSQILDARPSTRFHAVEKEFREGLRSGHVPNSINVPFTELVVDGFMKSDAELKTLFSDAGVEKGKPIITSCGSGVTAAIVLLALHKIGFTDLSLYDGSWAEWGSDESLPIEPSVT